jgi:hypothetical protein
MSHRPYKTTERRFDWYGTVAPRETAKLVINAQDIFRPEEWIIEEGVDYFVVKYIQIGGVEQLPRGVESIPARLLVGPGKLWLQTVTPASALAVMIRNVDHEPRTFKSRWKCISPNPLPVAGEPP